MDATLVGTLNADRICQRCLHQLHGAQIYRDRRLDLLYTRCTECGLVGAVTEYPASWKWLRRASFVLIAGLVLVATLFLIGDVAATSSISVATAEEATGPFANALNDVGRARDPNAGWIVSQALRDDAAAFAAILADTTFVERARLNFAFMMIPMSIIAAAGGTLWSCMLMHRRVWWAVAFQIVLLLLAAIFAGIAMQSQVPWDGVSWNYRDFALYRAGWPYLAAAFGWLALVRVVATLVARPLVRLFVWIVVPRRVWLAMRSVWTDDALPG